ncbi:MAG: dCTP deaminase domain-containing protein, partial [Cetobacterium sp.]
MKNFDPRAFIDYEGDEVIIPPNSFVLARSIEYMRIPDNVMVVALGKSTYARI